MLKRYMGAMGKRITTKEHGDKIYLYRNNDFREMAQIMLSFKTYYSGKFERGGGGGNTGPTWPTCGEVAYIQAQLTMRRKSFGVCSKDYSGRN